MTDCRKCKRTDVKCCTTCERNSDECNVWHNCGEDCPKYIKAKQTNADRIRQITDEELAQIIMCPYENMSGECMCEKDTRTNCIQCCLEWLRKEVEEKDE